MRLFLSLLLFCLLSVTVSIAQQRTSTPKKGTSTPKKGAPVRRPASTVKKPAATQPAPATYTPPVSMTTSMPASLTFPSTEAETEPMDPVKKQQMYDELHGVKPQTTTPQTRGNAGRATAEKRPVRRPSVAGSEAGSYIGIKAGGDYTTFLDAPVSSDPIYGFHAGVVFQFGNGGIAFQPEILYNRNSYQGFSASSLLVPLLVKFQFGQQGNTRFFVNAGPYGQYSLTENSESVVNYGGALGLGAGVPLGAGKLTLEARGYYLLGSTADGVEFGNYPYQPLSAQLSVGYLFPLGRR